jgi:hypothetical protein
MLPAIFLAHAAHHPSIKPNSTSTQHAPTEAPKTMMFFSHNPLALLVLLAIGTMLSDAQDCAAETAALWNSPNVTAAYAQMDQDIIVTLESCLTDGSPSCSVIVDLSGVEQACTSEGGKFSTPELDVSCTNSNTGLATIIDYEYVVCIGANCTEAEGDFDDAANNALANITDKINDVVAPDGVQCSALLISGANSMPVALMTSLVTFVAYTLI